MAYLDDHPPKRAQQRKPRRERPSGVIVVHTAESAPDTVAPDAGAESGSEIVVTGMKFDRSLQDTPESVKVFTAEDIDRQNLVNVYDLIDRTANLSSTFANSGFNIRGISNTNVSGYGFGDLATVYLDGSPLPR